MLKAIVIVLAIIGGLVVLSVGTMALMHFGMAGGMGCCQARRLRKPIGDR